MAKVEYNWNGHKVSLDRHLVKKWKDREGITEGEQLDTAMQCIMMNAEGRLKLENTIINSESLAAQAEELIKEEIRLTGECVK